MIDTIFCILFILTAISEIMLWRAIRELRQDSDLLSRRITTAHARIDMFKQTKARELNI